MKTKIWMSLALALALGINASAQKHAAEKATPEQLATKMTEKMAEKLSLTDEQKTAVYDANLALAKENKEARENRKQAMQTHDAAMKKTLTEEQYETYKALRKERRAHQAERRERKP